MESADIKELYSAVVNSSEYADKKDRIDYLAHFFAMLDNKLDRIGNWQLGFYNKKEDVIIVFELMQDGTINVSESKPLKKEEHVVGELKIEELELNFDEALKKQIKFQKEKYPGNMTVKMVVLLQELEKSPVWNLTVVTSTYNTLNVKIHAKTGEIIDHSLDSLLSWGEQLK
ncbi:hypothetical protein KY336_01085 [Candidatus Woesearchaeota archaeon]|nr:hypothetical protein [Candidatus Woesearchaeota archaeon]